MPMPDKEALEQFQQALVDWFQTFGRALPWRHTADPYQVLVAEMLLQQTDARKVVPVFETLVNQYPTATLLAAADRAEIEALIEPIGLHYRAERLHRLAVSLAVGGVPSDEHELLKLHGVGRYMARAVMCFAYGQPVGVLDTNVLRILDRVFGIRSERSRPHTDREMWDMVNRLIPTAAAREYNLALLDLAAALCRPTNPKCGECPLDFCQYRQERGKE